MAPRRLLPDFKPLLIDNSSQHQTALYVWLQDGAGNVDYHNFASVTLPGNPNVPAVAITGPTIQQHLRHQLILSYSFPAR